MSVISMTEQDRQIAEVIAKERPRLRSFIRKRVPNDADVEELLQEVFLELVAAHRLLLPIDFVTGWLFRVARNRITDLFRKRSRSTLRMRRSRMKTGRYWTSVTCCHRPTLGRKRSTCATCFLRN